MKKIVIFTHNLGYGGIEKYTSSLANLLSDEFEVEIICSFNYAKEPAFEINKKVKITYLINDKPDSVSIKEYIKSFKIFAILKEIKRRKKLNNLYLEKNAEIIKKLDCDYIITTRASLTKLVNNNIKNKDIVLIATDHNYQNNDKNYSDFLINSLSNFHYLVVSTEEMFDFYKNKVGKTKCIKISNMVDEIQSKKSNLQSKNIISVGRFAEEKGFLDLIDVFYLINKENKNIKLFLLGDGYQKNEIQRKIKKLNLNKYIELPGFVSPKEQKKYYLDSSLYVMTSYTEAFGLVLIESMNYGVPCIAFDSASGARELLKNSIGLLVENRDKASMAKECLKLLGNQTELKRLSIVSNKKVKEYSFENIKKEWYKLIIK